MTAATLFAVALFAGYCHLHALVDGVAIPPGVSVGWGLLTGVPAGAIGHALWRGRDRLDPARRKQLALVALLATLSWGLVARSGIVLGAIPDARGVVAQLFAVLPVALAFAGAAALLPRHPAPPPAVPAPPSPWLDLPEEPHLRLRAEDVVWIGAAGNYCEFHTAGRTHLVRLPLSRVADRLRDQGFARAHRSSLVNLAALISIERGRVAGRSVARMRGGVELSVGRRFRDGLLTAVGGRSSRA